ncbi:uncharacterized protein EDB93DRAFT_1085024 [Suillus bovinus]|uniref:uncharacterized protein n=1 Tax=Suillus bovinus TaxID=48563 RepID=UPI001B875D16|nr:uncharacterized protein EDB93DRAFT_1085024 [Suillus bovinus]KAG2148201.1 hypothetical protein EDB93DRAFT_1085024 [Suillus bovinus]
MALVIWIAIFKILIHFLYIYINDSFSFKDKHSLELYSPYQKVLPSNLVKLLRLWDAIGLPHEEKKQVLGLELPIIGFDVDPNLMRECMSPDSRTRLIQELSDFAQRDFQRLAGWLNWALNVYPLLQPGLSALYAKTSGKLVSKALLWVNRDVVRELSWVINHLRAAEGIFFFKSVTWNFAQLSDDVLRVYTDASGSGLAFWYPSLNTGFQSSLPGIAPTNTIFFFKALTVTAALLDSVGRLKPNQWVAIFTDNLNSVSMFNSLAALPPYNWLLMTAVDSILAAQVDFRIFFILGMDNMVADHLSHWKNAEAQNASPGLTILPFEPPRNTLGVVQK